MGPWVAGRLGADSSEGAPVNSMPQPKTRPDSPVPSLQRTRWEDQAPEGGAEETGEGAAEAGLGELSTRPFLWDLLVLRGHKPKSQLRGGEKGWGSEAERKGPPDRGVGERRQLGQSTPTRPLPQHVGASRFTWG